MLLWLWLLVMYSALVTGQNRYRNRELMPYVISTLMTTSLLFLAMLVIAEDPFDSLPHEPRDGQGLNPLLQNPDGDPSAESLPGICRFRRAFCICDWCFGEWASRYPMDTEYTPLDARRLALSRCRYPPRRTMGLCRTRMGRILGLGSGRKCVIHAMAYGHSISPFGDDSGKKGMLGLEYGFDHFDLRPLHLWHVSHAEWRDCFRACFRPIFAWSLFFALPQRY